MFSFVSLGIFDIIDIAIVALIFYQIYRLVRGTAAVNIFIGIIFFMIFGLVFRALNMELISTIMGQFMSMGFLALLIVFQQEIRRFLLLLGSKYNFRRLFSSDADSINVSGEVSRAIADSCDYFSKTKTGALIVFEKNTELKDYVNTGVTIKARVTEELLENIFFKNTPLHDGAVIIANNKIVAARCILPVSDRQDIPGSMGLRHRAALGMSALSDAYIVVVSEETGGITFFKDSSYKTRITPTELRKFLSNDFTEF